MNYQINSTQINSTKKFFQSLFSKIIQKICTAQFAVVLFILLAILIIVGTVLPQEPQVGLQALKDKYSNNYKLVAFFGLNDVFHSWWYILLFAFLALNLTLVSFIKVFPRAKKGYAWPAFIKSYSESKIDEFVVSKSNSFVHLGEAEDWQKITHKLKKKGWQVRFNQNQDSLIARKGWYHRFGPSITHVGILTILLGAAISLLFGFNGVIQGVPGDSFIISDREDSPRSYILVSTSKIFHSPLWIGKSPELELEIQETSRQNYANGNPKQWFSTLRFTNSKNASQDFKLAVNEPVTFAGIDFFQADWKRLLRLNFNNKNFEIELSQLKSQAKTMTDEGLETALISANNELSLLMLVGKKPNNPNSLKIFSLKLQGDESSNQTSLVNDLIESGKLKFLAELTPKESLELGPMKLKFLGAFSQTGIQYKYSPGDLLMILGMGILLLGVFVAFGAKRVVWLCKTKNNKIILLGNSDRHKQAFEAEFKEIRKPNKATS